MQACTSNDHRNLIINLNNKECHFALPSFFDVHVHGGYGYLVFDKNKNLLLNYLKQTLREGVSKILITTLTNDLDETISYLKWVKDIIDEAPWEKQQMAKIIGVHLEGPFINKKMKGAQNYEYIVKAKKETVKLLQEASGNNVKLITYAPELISPDFQEYLKELKIVGSCGHTDASRECISELNKYGLSHITHMFNAMRPLHHRNSSVIEEAFLNSKLNCELITDFLHISKGMLTIAKNNLEIDQIQIITDSIHAKGMQDGKYVFAGLNAVKKGKEFRLVTGELAGSISKFNENISRIASLWNLNLNEVVKISSENQFKEIFGYTKTFEQVFIENETKDFFVFNNEFKPLYYVNKLGVKEL